MGCWGVWLAGGSGYNVLGTWVGGIPSMSPARDPCAVLGRWRCVGARGQGLCLYAVRRTLVLYVVLR